MNPKIGYFLHIFVAVLPIFLVVTGSHKAIHAAEELTLAPPKSQAVWLKGIETEIGSTDLEILEAQDLCSHARAGTSSGRTQEPFCTEGLFADEMPKHAVALSGFFIDRREVSVAEYRSCVLAQRCQPLRESEGTRRFFLPNRPVSLVTWSEARTFCEFRGGRLPTEAEFERAARGPLKSVLSGGVSTQRGRIFPWGDLYNSHVSNHGGSAVRAPLGLGDEDSLTTDARDGFEEQADVGSFPAGATPEGVLDLGGNVAEWVLDLYAAYPKPRHSASALRDPRGPDTTETGMRVARGGHFKSSPAWLRSAARQAFLPETRSPALGFRCVREPGAKSKASYP